MLLAGFSKTDSVVQFLTLFVIFAIVIFITYFTVRWTTRIQQGQAKSSNIDIIETKRITNNKYLQIIRAGDKYILIGIGKDEITMLKELDPDELLLKSDSDMGGLSFDQVLSKFKNLNNKKED